MFPANILEAVDIETTAVDLLRVLILRRQSFRRVGVTYIRNMASTLVLLLASRLTAAAVVTDPLRYVDQLIGTTNGGQSGILHIPQAQH